MKIKLNSVFVDDQDKALKFYTKVLGFVKKRDIPVGNAKFLTVVSPEEPDSTELVLEPDDNPAAKAFKKALYEPLINPDNIKQYMFGTNAVSDWKEGSSIVWKGEWQGKKYEDRGVILKMEPGHVIQYSHFSPLTGQPDLPENYHIVTMELSIKGKQTLVSLLQDNNATEEAREHSEKNWNMMLGGLKKFLEK